MHRNIPIKDSESLFVCYEAIARLTAEMVNAAEVEIGRASCRERV